MQCTFEQISLNDFRFCHEGVIAAEVIKYQVYAGNLSKKFNTIYFFHITSFACMNNVIIYTFYSRHQNI